MNTIEAQLAAHMRALAVRLVERTKGELREMRAHAELLHVVDEAALTKLRHWAHRLRGTAASLGLATIGAEAFALQGVLLALRAQDTDARAQVTARLDSLEREVTRLSVPEPS